MRDTIYREEAIDALAKAMPSWTTPDGSGEFDHDIQITDEAFVDAMQIIQELPSAQPQSTMGQVNYTAQSTNDCISRQDAIDALAYFTEKSPTGRTAQEVVKDLPFAQLDYTEMKQEFLRMAAYIDVLLECSDEQKETLIGFISRLAEFMPWTERD